MAVLLRATRTSGDPVLANNGRFYIHSDHLGSATFLTHGNGHASEGNKVANSTKFFTPFGEYRIQPSYPTSEITDRGFTVHKHNDDIGLIYMNARYYLGYINRFLSPDPIIPDPSNPQSLNRYSYVFNRPTFYNDPSGHCPWCIGAIEGAIFGGVAAYASQVYTNYQSGLSLSDSLTTDINIGQIAGGAVSGAIIGGTFGAAGGIAGLGFTGTVAIGAVANVVEGQVEALVNATADEIRDYLIDGNEFEAVELWEKALGNGFLDESQIIFDSATGAIGGAVAYGAGTALTKFARNAGLLPWQTGQDPTVTFRYLKSGPGAGYQLFGLSREPITLSETMYNTYLEMLATQGADSAARWLINNLPDRAEDAVEEVP